MKQDLKSMTLAEMQEAFVSARRAEVPRKAGLHVAASRRDVLRRDDESFKAAA